MPRSKKGRLSGSMRKELNERRAADAVSGRADGIMFARVHKMTGSGHILVLVPSKQGNRELKARIPNILGRRGSTPITTKDIVSIYVGPDFDINTDLSSNDHFDVTSILTHRQAYKLSEEGHIPKWMLVDASADGAKDSVAEAAGGFEFDYSTSKVDEEDEKSDEEDSGFRRKPVAGSGAQEELDVDEI